MQKVVQEYERAVIFRLGRLRQGGAKGPGKIKLCPRQDFEKLNLKTILIEFWEGHDPTQGMRQGNDIGTQYRSAIFVNNSENLNDVKTSKIEFQSLLDSAGFNKITTEIKKNIDFYFAETYHQQYLYKNPNGYCGLGGCGVKFK